MPLMHGKGKKAFGHNVKAEMDAGKPQPQALAIAYSVKRKGKKKMAEGGPVSAKSEARPMPDAKGQEQVSRNSGNKPPKNDQWLDQPTVAQAQSNNGRMVKPIAKPRMVPSNAFSIRMRDEEDHLQSSAGVNDGPQEQPPKHDDEEGPDRQGPQVHDMQDEHSTGRKPYAKGGKVEQADYGHKANKYEDDLLDLGPSHDEGAQMADSHDEEGANRQGHPVMDMEEPHNDDQDMIYGFADGGEVENDHADSIAAAIMAKRDRMHAAIDSGARDLDEAVKMAEGGQVDLSINADEEPNNEDQMSFEALKKENYSESEGLEQLGDQPHDSNLKGDAREHDEEDKHDMVDAISNKIARRRQFKVR